MHIWWLHTKLAEVSAKCIRVQLPSAVCLIYRIIGASLSEPHTSMTALRTRVSIYLSDYGPTTYRKF